MNNRTTGEAGLQLIKRFEGLRTSAYLCPAGVPTIGYGHVKGVKMGDRCTEAQANQWLQDDVQDAEKAVSRYVKVPLTQNQFDALVSFTFNLGSGALFESTLLRLLNREDYEGASGQFSRWVKAGGRTLPGLVSRRAAEQRLFLQP